MEKIKIGCPKCGSTIYVNDPEQPETAAVRCPVCKKVSFFTAWRRIADDDPQTQLPDDNINRTLGRLVAVSTNTTYPLQIGRNVVGRKASGSAAHVQIACESRRMSREHLVVEVKNELGKGLVHYLSLNKAQVNATYVDSMKLEYGDRVILRHNTMIHLPDMDLRFEIPDEEGTELNIT